MIALWTARLSLIFVVLIWQSASNSPQKTSESSPQAVLRYVLKAEGFALTSSIARTNRSQRSRELVGRMTGGGLISGQDSLVTSSNLGRYSSSFARWRSKGDEKDNSIFIDSYTYTTKKIFLKLSSIAK